MTHTSNKEILFVFIRPNGGVKTCAIHLGKSSYSDIIIYNNFLSALVSVGRINNKYKYIILSAHSILLAPLLDRPVIYLHGTRGFRRSIPWSLSTIALVLTNHLCKALNKPITYISNSVVTLSANYLAFGIRSTVALLPFNDLLNPSPFIQLKTSNTNQHRSKYLVYWGHVNKDKAINKILILSTKLNIPLYLYVPELPVNKLFSNHENVSIYSYDQLFSPPSDDFMISKPIYISLSLCEPFGYVFLEALRARIPVILSKYSGFYLEIISTVPSNLWKKSILGICEHTSYAEISYFIDESYVTSDLLSFLALIFGDEQFSRNLIHGLDSGTSKVL